MRYSYKDSEIGSLGEIPEHWKVNKIKNGFWVKPSNVDKKTFASETPVELCNYVDVYYNDYISNSLNFMEASASSGEIKKFQIEGGDVIITKDSEDPSDIGVPALVKESKEKLLCGYHLTLIRSKSPQFYGPFLFWALKDKSIGSQLRKEATGITRWAIASKHVKNVEIPLPPLPEQKAIAAYLDQACARIDRIIEIKQRQLEKIRDYYQKKLTQYVTLGLNKESNSKTTKYPWLPQINESWRATELKRVLAEKLKYGANESAEEENRENPRYIRITDFRNNGKLKKSTFKSLPLEKAKDYLLKEGDVLFARSGATVGKTFLFKDYEGMACYAGYLIKADLLRHRMKPEYLYYYTKSRPYEEWKNLIFTQATIQNIGADKYQYLAITLPPIEEQVLIIDRIQLVEAKIDSLTQKIEKNIEQLKNYRKSLIHECVTGKKQVYNPKEQQMQQA